MARNGKAGWIAGFLALSMWMGCAGFGPTGKSGNANSDADGNDTHAAAAQSAAVSKGADEPTELDRMLDAKPITLAAVKPANTGTATAATTPAAPVAAPAGKAKFRLQIGAESDVDAAQSKQAEYERKLGGSVDMVFDAPYYKLRWGYFETKQDAEDKILEISDQKIQAFVIKN